MFFSNGQVPELHVLLMLNNVDFGQNVYVFRGNNKFDVFNSSVQLSGVVQ